MKLGMIGKAGHGKDYIAQIIIDKLNRLEIPSKRYAFADEMKRQIENFLGLFKGSLDSVSFKNSMHVNKKTMAVTKYPERELGEYWTMREFMQYYGTDVMKKAFGKNIWINKCFMSIFGHNRLVKIPVITDVRFKDEYKAVKSDDGVLIRVVNPNIVSTDTHSSEIDLDDMPADYTIINDWKNNPEKVREDVDALIQQIVNEFRNREVLQISPSGFKNKEIQEPKS